IAVHAAARDHIDCRVGAEAQVQALETASPAGVRGGGRGRDSLLVAGEIRYPSSTTVRSDFGRAGRISPGPMDAKPEADPGSQGADDSIRALRPERRRDGSQRADPLRRARASGSRRWPAARRKVRMAEGLPKPAQRPEMQRQQTEREPAHADFLTNEYTKAPGRR